VDGQLVAWQTERLRLTAFPSPSAHITNPQWWREIMREEPESRVSQPRRGGLREEGPLADGKLLLGVEPTRIDWLFLPMPDDKRQTEVFLTIGSLPETLETFLPLMRQWFELESCPALKRLALGAVLYQRVQDIPSGYQLLAPYLPAISWGNLGDSSDFLYQINRPRSSRSGIAGLSINRLSKWSVILTQLQEVLVTPASLQYSMSHSYYACRLELDINTSPAFLEELQREHLSRVLQELVDLGTEIARQGDLP